MRAYGHEPVLLPKSPVSEPAHSGRVRRSRRRWLLVTVLGMAFVGALGLVLAITRQDTAAPGPIPQHIKNAAAFSLYVPGWLPPRAAIDASSFDATSQVVTFSVAQDTKPLLAVTQQPLPPANNLKDFYQQQLAGSQELPSDVGIVMRGVFEGSLLAGVEAGQTWVLIRATSGINQSDFDRIVTSLHAVQ